MSRPLVLAAVLAFALPVSAHAQHPQSTTTVVEGVDFRVYDGDGRSKSFADVLAAMDDADAMLVGESHDDVVGHGVETQILVRAAQRFGAMEEGGPSRQVILSLEMFERDVQYILDEYMQGLITEGQFKSSSRPWERYDTDYRPMVEFSRGHGLPVVAANAPRRYINRVTRLGPESLAELSDEAKRFLPPLPYPGPSDAYRAEWDGLMAEMMAEMRGSAPAEEAEEEAEAVEEEEEEAPTAEMAPPTHGMGYALDSQALWDAAMGHAVARALQSNPGGLVVHYAGSFHVGNYTGIPERLPEYRPGTRVITVVLEPADDIDGWDDDEHEGLGDFVILTQAPPEAEGTPGR